MSGSTVPPVRRPSDSDDVLRRLVALTGGDQRAPGPRHDRGGGDLTDGAQADLDPADRAGDEIGAPRHHGDGYTHTDILDDPQGCRPARRLTTAPDPRAWEDPPWWRRIRWAPHRPAAIALAAAVVVLAVVAVHRLSTAAPPAEVPLPPLAPVTERGLVHPGVGGDPAGAPAGAAPAPAEPLVVAVVGLVPRSGLVTLAPGARVADALDAAGGVLPEGDRDGLNLARRVNDGEQVLVGVAPGPDGPRGPRSAIVSGDSGIAPPAGAPEQSAVAPGAPAGPAPTGGGPGVGGRGPVNINTADAAELDTLPGVGPATASAILGWRAANGPFSSVDQLTEVDGIGPATLSRLRPLVTV